MPRKAARPAPIRAAAAPAAASATQTPNAASDAAGADPAAAAGEVDGGERERGAERAGGEAERDALERRERDQVAAAGAARAEQREVAAVALGRAERGEVGEPERDERAGHGEHDVERLGVERVAGRGVQAVGEVVDEDDLAGQRALDAVAELRRLLRARARGCPLSAAGSTCACTCHCVPVCAPGHGGRARRRC